MKKRMAISALGLLAALCFALFLFAACDDEPAPTPPPAEKKITATLSDAEVLVGEKVTLTYAASGGEAVTVTYSKDGGEAVPVTGTEFTPQERGSYVFTFAAEGYDSVQCTLLAKTEQDALFAGGWGTAEDPYRIASAAQLKNIGKLEGSILGGETFHYVLTQDIDLSSETGNAPYFAKVIGGVLDGDGHTVRGGSAFAYVFDIAHGDTTFRDLTVSFGASVTRLVRTVSYTANGVYQGKEGWFTTDAASLALTYDNVDYIGQEGVRYDLGANNAALYYNGNCTVMSAWYEGAFVETYNDQTFVSGQEGKNLTFRIGLDGCDVKANFTGGSGASGAAVFFGGQIYSFTFPSVTDCSFTGTIAGKNVGVLFANSNLTVGTEYFKNVTVDGLTVQGTIRSLGGNSGVTFGNSKTEHAGVSDEAKACVTNVGPDASLAVAGEQDGAYTVTAAAAQGVAYYELSLSLASVRWYADGTYTGDSVARTDSNNLTIRVEKDELSATGAYKAKAVTLREAKKDGIVDGSFACSEKSKEGFYYAFAEKGGTRYLVIDYEKSGRYFVFAKTDYVKATVFAYDAAGLPLCLAAE